MVKVKIEHYAEKDVQYGEDQWDLLKSFRIQAMKIAAIFHTRNIDTLTYGSVARGDVKPTSDIDIIVCSQIPSFQLELMLEEFQIPIHSRKIVQATPNDVIKANYEIEENICLTLPLTQFTSMPYEFYRFGGAVSHEQLAKNIRVPGVDKRLMLIEPRPFEHHEVSLLDRLVGAGKLIGVSQAMVEQRVRVLSRRDKIGRTGVFLNYEVRDFENIEEALQNVAKSNRLVRRRLQL